MALSPWWRSKERLWEANYLPSALPGVVSSSLLVCFQQWYVITVLQFSIHWRKSFSGIERFFFLDSMVSSSLKTSWFSLGLSFPVKDKILDNFINAISSSAQFRGNFWSFAFPFIIVFIMPFEIKFYNIQERVSSTLWESCKFSPTLSLCVYGVFFLCVKCICVCAPMVLYSSAQVWRLEEDVRCPGLPHSTVCPNQELPVSARLAG